LAKAPQGKLPAKPPAAALPEKAGKPATKAPEEAKRAERKTAMRKGSADKKELSADKADK
jgi:hypothetical protein